MTPLMQIAIYVAGGASIGALITYALMAAAQRELKTRLEIQTQTQDKLAETFKALSSDALKSSNEQFLTLATENLQRFQQQADNQLQQKQTAIAEMLKPVSETLQKMDGKIAEIEQKREGAYEGLKTLVGEMKDQHLQLQSQTSSLAQALRTPTVRGKWGEAQLVRVLQFSGLIEKVHYKTQAHVPGMRPDVVVDLPPNKVLVIDAKVPMQNYLNAMQEDISEEAKNVFLTKHATDMKEHIKSLSNKDYTQGFDSFDWVVMFVPLDGLIQMAMDKQPDLVEFAWQRNVVLATPMNLLGLMRTVSYANEQFKISENAKDIANMGEDLYKKVMIFANHIASMGKALGSATDHYNKAVGSLERNVMSGLRRMKEMGIATDASKDVQLTSLEELPRRLTAPELIDAQEEI